MKSLSIKVYLSLRHENEDKMVAPPLPVGDEESEISPIS